MAVMQGITMDDRVSAVALAADTSARDNFLEALIRLKNRQAVGAPNGFSVYDQFVLIHGAIMALRVPGWPGTVNVGHWNIGFCPWHRIYLREFELALQNEVAGVMLPYWDWTDHATTVSELFSGDFLSELRSGNASPVTDGVLRNPVPPAERPSWWPGSLGVTGFPIFIEEGRGPQLTRGTPSNVSWPPTPQAIQTIETLDQSSSTLNRYWIFWLALEGGVPGVNLGSGLSALAARTHNAGHNFIGGHMAGSFSPNDPVFFLHHANVDRIWDNWQKNMRAAHAGSNDADHYPPDNDVTPWDGQPIPRGHRIDDALWPWVGGVSGYDATGLTQAAKDLLPDTSADPAVTVRDVLDVAAMDYRYV